MTDDELYRPPEDDAAAGRDLVAHELSHVVQSGEVAPDDDGETLRDEVTYVVESAAEVGFGAVIVPFTGGETVTIISSVASMLEAGVDRLTHLGEHETPPEPDSADPADDGRE